MCEGGNFPRGFDSFCSREGRKSLKSRTKNESLIVESEQTERGLCDMQNSDRLGDSFYTNFCLVDRRIFHKTKNLKLK